MKKRRCKVCNRVIRLMTPPANGVCSEVCRKIKDREITPEQGKVIRRAALKTNPKEN